jgi:hypothetical protein
MSEVLCCVSTCAQCTDQPVVHAHALGKQIRNCVTVCTFGDRHAQVEQFVIEYA